MIKKIYLLAVIIALLFSCGIYSLSKYKKNENKVAYLLQIGAYQNYDNALEFAKKLDSYTIKSENNLYKIIVGITMNDEVYNKLISYYGSDYETYKKTIKIEDKNLEKTIKMYDSVLKSLEDKEDINLILKEELKYIDNIKNT